ncbi:hypothetical protein C8F04DRAFT_1276196 [Mycena alexandri]|uniref:Uncharacterized protein n=1 Tax=Mycena alexandri TaxID=1745969 RepID=A0AAD6S249_9AGAR|nr:hypothetical protein C8F04DRAFT_1282333 [Mycena alexandri]KAJ7016790.1 hypothetical protein C8F04DRAFT_1280594 [Mycena alexandri]KAJ7019515.1 hypothetical protein C8F04DRAFT_1276196 [Mycena alexandri]
MVQITIVLFVDTKIVFYANVHPGHLNAMDQRHGPTLSMFPPMSLSASEQSVTAVGILDTIPVPREMPWSLEAVKAVHGSVYCTTYLDANGVYQVAEVWAYGSLSMAHDTFIYSPAAWIGPAEVIHIADCERAGCCRVRCRLEAGQIIFLDVPVAHLSKPRLTRNLSAMFCRGSVARRNFRTFGTFNHFRPRAVEALNDVD